jgi:hypothetical protein
MVSAQKLQQQRQGKGELLVKEHYASGLSRRPDQ